MSLCLPNSPRFPHSPTHHHSLLLHSIDDCVLTDDVLLEEIQAGNQLVDLGRKGGKRKGSPHHSARKSRPAINLWIWGGREWRERYQQQQPARWSEDDGQREGMVESKGGRTACPPHLRGMTQKSPPPCPPHLRGMTQKSPPPCPPHLGGMLLDRRGDVRAGRVIRQPRRPRGASEPPAHGSGGCAVAHKPARGHAAGHADAAVCGGCATASSPDIVNQTCRLLLQITGRQAGLRASLKVMRAEGDSDPQQLLSCSSSSSALSFRLPCPSPSPWRCFGCNSGALVVLPPSPLHPLLPHPSAPAWRLRRGAAAATRCSRCASHGRQHGPVRRRGAGVVHHIYTHSRGPA